VVNKDLIIDVGDSEVTLALLEDKQLIELNKEKRNIRFSVGDIYLGRIKKIMPGLNAAFRFLFKRGVGAMERADAAE
jgi:ribonuclease G